MKYCFAVRSLMYRRWWPPGYVLQLLRPQGSPNKSRVIFRLSWRWCESRCGDYLAVISGCFSELFVVRPCGLISTPHSTPEPGQPGKAPLPAPAPPLVAIRAPHNVVQILYSMPLGRTRNIHHDIDQGLDISLSPERPWPSISNLCDSLAAKSLLSHDARDTLCRMSPGGK